MESITGYGKIYKNENYLAEVSYSLEISRTEQNEPKMIGEIVCKEFPPLKIDQYVLHLQENQKLPISIKSHKVIENDPRKGFVYKIVPSTDLTEILNSML